MNHKTDSAAASFIAASITNAMNALMEQNDDVPHEVIDAANDKIIDLKKKHDVLVKMISDFQNKMVLFTEVSRHPSGRNLDYLRVIVGDMEMIVRCCTDVLVRKTMQEFIDNANLLIREMKLFLNL